jgi:hypothetical protein
MARGLAQAQVVSHELEAFEEAPFLQSHQADQDNDAEGNQSRNALERL